MWQPRQACVVAAFVFGVAMLTEPATAAPRNTRKILGIIGGAAIGGAILNELNKKLPSARTAIPRERSVSPSGRDADAEGSLEDRIAIQSALIELGYDVGEPDGKFGQKVRKAIRAWQTENGDEPTGRLTLKQRLALLQPGTPVPGASPVKPSIAPFVIDPGFLPGALPPVPGPGPVGPVVIPPRAPLAPVAGPLRCNADGAGSECGRPIRSMFRCSPSARTVRPVSK